MATLLVEALKGAQVRVVEGVRGSTQPPTLTHHTVPVQAEVAAQQGLFEQLRRAGKLSGILAQELRLAVSLSPFGVRAVRIRRCAQHTQRLLQPLSTSLWTGADAAPA